MRKVLAVVMAAVMVMSVAAPAVQAAASESGGVAGFFVGCCLGLRTGADFNDGKDIHWRDIGRAIPYVNIVFAIWDGVDIAGGKGRSDLQQVYPGNYY